MNSSADGQRFMAVAARFPPSKQRSWLDRGSAWTNSQEALSSDPTGKLNRYETSLQRQLSNLLKERARHAGRAGAMRPKAKEALRKPA